ncbi:hypothetical protein AB0M02_00290 [Actinoplanes sp. NPDC051861]|uniref:hypothetical protein n=1 Tax=Actinoplanes sp. NPDC051861 TaxID=3155170 RepID=UPI003430959F
MSYKAVQWAMDEAPMLRMPGSGLPDTTARAVLVARAERADEHGGNSHAAVADIVWRTGYDARTVERAQARLEAAGLLVDDGVTRWGTRRWNLDMTKRRNPAERDQIEEDIDRKKAEHAARERARRARQRQERADAESARAHSKSARADAHDARADAHDARADAHDARADAAPGEPPMNHPGTTREPSLEPPTGGAPPPDPRRLPPAAPSGTELDRSLSEPLTPAQDQEGESLPRTHARDEPADLRLVAANPQPAPSAELLIRPGTPAVVADAIRRRATARHEHRTRNAS